MVSTLVVLVVLNGQQQQTTATLRQAISNTHGDGVDRRDTDDSAVRNVAIAVLDGHGTRIEGVMPVGLPDRAVMARVARTGRADQRQVVLAGRHFAVRTAVHGDATVQAVMDLREQREEIARLLQAIVVGGAIGVAPVSAVAVLLGRRAVRPLAEALTLQQRFVADAAHELRTPLTLLSTRAQLLGRRLQHAEMTDPAAQTQLEAGARELVADAASLTEILEDLLLAADRTAELPDVPVDLAAVAREAVTAAAVAADPAGIRIRLAISADDDALHIGAGSRPAVLRAANALIDNAVTHASSQVDVRVVPRGGGVDLEVADDGPGIDAQTLPTIFERFASRRAAGESGPHGRRHYGLGLALVSDVAARHGGTVGVEHRADGHSGAVFRLHLPTGVRR